MGELVIEPGPGVPDGLAIPASELTERFTRASGPGGQSVNTTDSKVQLSIDLATASVFTEPQRRRLLSRLRHRLAGSVLTIEASEQRSQFQNRAAARARLAGLLREALAPPPAPRRASRPTRGSVERRLATKRRRAATKADRRRPGSEEH